MLYFARLREVFERAAEEVDLPAGIANVEALTMWLRERGGAWAAELAPGRAFRVAVNQEMAHANSPISEGAEIAIFPPVTGG
jgi:molybdopterin synthase sulfur carrier subunit